MPWWNQDTQVCIMEVQIYQSNDHRKQIAYLEQKDLRSVLPTQDRHCGKASVHFVERASISLTHWQSCPSLQLWGTLSPRHECKAPLTYESAPTSADSAWLRCLPNDKWHGSLKGETFNSENLLNPSDSCLLLHLLTHHWFNNLAFLSPPKVERGSGGSVST